MHRVLHRVGNGLCAIPPCASVQRQVCCHSPCLTGGVTVLLPSLGANDGCSFRRQRVGEGPGMGGFSVQNALTWCIWTLTTMLLSLHKILFGQIRIDTCPRTVSLRDSHRHTAKGRREIPRCIHSRYACLPQQIDFNHPTLVDLAS